MHADVEASLELAEVPRDALVEERVGLISTVDWSLISERLPVQCLNLDVRIGTSNPISLLLLEVL